jgi:hypothetical protein
MPTVAKVLKSAYRKAEKIPAGTTQYFKNKLIFVFNFNSLAPQR